MTDTIPAGAPAPGTYTLDPERTTIRADVKAMFGLTTVHGTFRLQSGQVSIGADPGASSVQASIAAGSYASGNTTRDADVLSANLLDARAYPEITFTGEGARRDGDGWVVPGSVTAHGTAVPAEVRLSDVREEAGEAEAEPLPASKFISKGFSRGAAIARSSRISFSPATNISRATPYSASSHRWW